MLKKSLMFALVGCLALTGLTGCQQQKDPGPDYADDEAMEIIADGIEARSDLVDKDEADGKDAFTMKTLKSYVEAELEVDEKLRTRVFEDSQMQESVLAYINTLDDALKVIESNSVTSAEFYDAWDKVYDKRTSLLKLFVDEYGLSVGEKHQEVFDEMIANGAAATKKSQIDEALETLMSSVTFEKQNDGYGLITYVAIVENTTGVDFGNVSMTLGLYDADGVRAQDAYLSTTSWPAGEKVKFETISEFDAVETRVTIDYYEVAE